MGFLNSNLFTSSSTVSNETRTLNAGFTDVSGPALAILGSGNSILLTDQGALKVAGDIAAQAFEQVELSGSTAARSIADAIDAIAKSDRAESENIVANVKTVAILGVVAWAVVAVSKGFQ